MLESNMSALWDSIKTRVRLKPAFPSAFCLFWRTKAINSGVVGAGPYGFLSLWCGCYFDFLTPFISVMLLLF